MVHLSWFPEICPFETKLALMAMGWKNTLAHCSYRFIIEEQKKGMYHNPGNGIEPVTGKEGKRME